MNHLNVIEAVRKWFDKLTILSTVEGMVRQARRCLGGQAHHPRKGPVGPEPIEGMVTVKQTDGCSRKAGVVALMHAVLGFLFVFTPSAAGIVDIVKDGKPVAVIVVQQTGEQQAPNQRGKSSRAGFELSDIGAADVLADWIEKITDARLARRRPGLELTSQPPNDALAIYIGAAALKAGLSLDQIQSPTSEGLRIVCDGAGRILIAGQNDSSTTKAVCRFLEELGCRYFMDNDLGEVYPRTKTLTVGKLDISEKPGFLLRKIWGSQWTGSSLWKTWNGDGGLPMATGHSWGKYVDESLFEQHPEYFALRDGQRRKGPWYCTSNPQLRQIFADGVIAKGGYNPSLSPPDGTGYCQCDKCLAQDDPTNIEPSSGRPSVTNRYMDFLDEVAQRIAKVHPDWLLSFYCYADYTQPPTLGRKPAGAWAGKLSPNLVAWVAPLRYSRYHRIGSPNSLSCMQLVNVIDGWADVANHIAYRTYNFNCAECLVPFSKLSIWEHDIPYLKTKGCIGINLESLANWEIYGPHLYQSICIAYNPDADSDALMDDYFTKFYGPEAGPLMKEYWLSIDKAFAELKCESGGFFALHLVYTPQFLQKLEGLIKKASSVTALDKTYSARVAMTGEGLKNAAQYIDMREATNKGDFSAARRIYDELCARNEAEQKKGYGNHYTLNYLRRFIGPLVAAGAQATAPPNKVLQVLPDRMKLEYDREDNGLAKGFHKAEFDDSKWKDAATYGSTLNAQGLPDVKSIMWYRTSIDIPRRHGPPARSQDPPPRGAGGLTLFFTEVDGQSVAVYLNGKEAASLGSEARRKPFEVDITGVAAPGQNTLSLRIDHSRITELFVGGIVRPILLIEKPAQ